MNEVLSLVILLLILFFFGKVVSGFINGIFKIFEVLLKGVGCLGSIIGYLLIPIIIIVIILSIVSG
jgi:hypothetical protein